jgi:hypothetical protein
VDEPHGSIQHFNDGTAITSDVTIVLSAPGKVVCANIDDKDLKQLLFPERPRGAGNPHQDSPDDAAEFIRHILLLNP